MNDQTQKRPPATAHYEDRAQDGRPLCGAPEAELTVNPMAFTLGGWTRCADCERILAARGNALPGGRT